MELGPYEVLIKWDRLARDIKLAKDQFIAALGTLRKMTRLELRSAETPNEFIARLSGKGTDSA